MYHNNYSIKIQKKIKKIKKKFFLNIVNVEHLVTESLISRHSNKKQ